MAGREHASPEVAGPWGLVATLVIVVAQVTLFFWLDASSRQAVSAIARANGAEIWWANGSGAWPLWAGVVGIATVVLLPAAFGSQWGKRDVISGLGPIRWWALGVVVALSVVVDVGALLSSTTGGYASAQGAVWLRGRREPERRPWSDASLEASCLVLPAKGAPKPTVTVEARFPDGRTAPLVKVSVESPGSSAVATGWVDDLWPINAAVPARRFRAIDITPTCAETFEQAMPPARRAKFRRLLRLDEANRF